MNKLITLIIASVVSSVSFAELFTYDPEATPVVTTTNCELSAMTITGMTNLADQSNPVPPAVNATDCYAVEGDPQNNFASEYIPNTGGLADGMFNGEISNKDYYIDPNLFLDNDKDSWVNGQTPGWISLASVNGAERDEKADLDAFEVSYSKIGDYNLDDLLDIKFGINIVNIDGEDVETGFWSIEFNPIDEDIVGLIEGILGRSTRFDHLSFVLKGANFEPWYMYDFSFWDLIDDPDLDLEEDILNVPHNIYGTWDPSKFFGGQDVSHMEIVAHDPPPNSFILIPEPNLLLLMLLGIGLLTLRVKNKHSLL